MTILLRRRVKYWEALCFHIQQPWKKTKKLYSTVVLLRLKEGFLKALTGKEISGYKTYLEDLQCRWWCREILNLTEDKRLILVAKHNIVATYLHGIFDNKFFTDYILTMLRDKKGLTSEENSLSYQNTRKNNLIF